MSRINPGTGTGVNFALPGGTTVPVGIGFDGTNIWTANAGSSNVTRINPGTGAVTSYPLPGATNPEGIAFDGTNIWTANINSGNVTRINPGTGAGVSPAVRASARHRPSRRSGPAGAAGCWPPASP